MTGLSIFRYDGADVRTVIIDGEPWFVAIDVCQALDIANSRDAVNRLDEDGVGTTDIIDSMGRGQTPTIINESALYELAFQSRKPEAKRFRRWITHEVIPAIRKTGSYSTAPALTEDQIIAQALQLTVARVEALTAQVGELTPRAEAWDELASAEGDYEVADAAKILARAGVETGRTRLFAQLEALGWIYRGSHGKWTARQTAVTSGYLAEKPMSHHHPRTGELVLDPPQIRVTLRGIERLRVRLGVLSAVATA
jgi:anti-repressor protein